MGGFYFFLSIVSIVCTWTAIVQARRLYWGVPVYFLSAWLAGELALIHLLWQVALTAMLAFTGVFADPMAQLGLALFALSWLGLIYLHCQAMDSPLHLTEALRDLKRAATQQQQRRPRRARPARDEPPQEG